MTYVMADIHGELDRWQAMLELIGFSEQDTLYILGDCIDRKPHGIAVLQDIMARSNVHMILGNHEKMCLDAFWSADPYEARRLWQQNGGGRTRKELLYARTTRERLEILRFIRELPDHLDIEVNGQQFHLVHGFPADNRHDRIWGRPEPLPETPPLPGKTVIVGHTCTYYLNLHTDGYDESAPFEIFHAPGLIAIDCGCGNATPLRRLACLRLEDGKEFYV